MIRMLSATFVLLGLAVALGAAATADDKDNTHTGKFISATGKAFKMEHKDGKEHSHTLTDDAKVIGEDGKDCKIADFRKGQKIRVTTREGDKTTAVRVEAIKDRNN